jgi:hypothetical protein
MISTDKELRKTGRIYTFRKGSEEDRKVLTVLRPPILGTEKWGKKL